jgi:hypothetical protein
LRIIIGLIVFIALWTLYLFGYRVTPPPDRPPAPLAPTSAGCPPPPDTPAPTVFPTVGTHGGGGAAGAPARGWPCPAVTSTFTVTAVPPDQQ